MSKQKQLKEKLKEIEGRRGKNYGPPYPFCPLEIIGEIDGLGKIAYIDQMSFYHVLKKVGLHRLVTQKQLYQIAVEAEYPHVGGFTREAIIYPGEDEVETILVKESPILKSLKSLREAETFEFAQLAYSLSLEQYQNILDQVKEGESKHPEERNAISLNKFLERDKRGDLGISISREKFNTHAITRMLYGDLVEKVNKVLCKDEGAPEGGIYLKVGRVGVLRGYDKSIVRQLWANSKFCYLDGTESFQRIEGIQAKMTLLYGKDEIPPKRIKDETGWDEKHFQEIEAIRNSEWYKRQVGIIKKENERELARG